MSSSRNSYVVFEDRHIFIATSQCTARPTNTYMRLLADFCGLSGPLYIFASCKYTTKSCGQETYIELIIICYCGKYI